LYLGPHSDFTSWYLVESGLCFFLIFFVCVLTDMKMVLFRLQYQDWRNYQLIILMFEHLNLNQANKGCGEGSEKETAEQGPKGSVLCFDGMYFHYGMTKHVRLFYASLHNKHPSFIFLCFIHISYKLVQLLETMMKNCGEYVRFEVAEQHVLQEMVKIIQKKV